MFDGSLLTLRPSETFFHLSTPHARVILERSTDGTNLLLISNMEKIQIILALQHHTIILHPSTQAFLWSSTLPEEGKVCYCFRLNSSAEYTIFQRATMALQRLSQSSMVHQSLLLESKMQASKVLQKTAASVGEKRENSVQSSSKAGSSTSSRPKRIEVEKKRPLFKCLLCKAQVPDVVGHPYVHQDGRGRAVEVCKPCIANIERSREAQGRISKLILENERSEEVCGLCGDGGEAREIDVYCCSFPQCPRSYCLPCCQTLLTAKQLNNLKTQEYWHCPNCQHEALPSTNKEEKKSRKLKLKAEKAEDGEEKQAKRQRKKEAKAIVLKEKAEAKALAKIAKAKAKMNKKVKTKRKRKKKEEDDEHEDEEEEMELGEEEEQVEEEQEEEEVEKEVEDPNVLPPVNLDMDAIDYFSNYVQFIVKREVNQGNKPLESEDACFCCKDGGSLVDCDFKNNNAKCPKVYHEECLGFDIPRGKKWHCPRHLCAFCASPPTFFCRYCVSSFCPEHVPPQLSKLGEASDELGPGAIYSMCGKCLFKRRVGVQRGLMPTDTGLRDRKQGEKKKRVRTKPGTGTAPAATAVVVYEAPKANGRTTRSRR